MNGPRTTLAALGAAAVLALAGCTSGQDDGIASAGGARDGAAPSTARVSDEERARQFVDCMRDNGIDLPDPVPDDDGGFDFGMADAGVDLQDPAFQEAIQACRDELPGGGQVDLDDPELQAQLREFAQCMRDKGIDMPDPEPGGGFGGVFGELDVNSPAFRTALEACQEQLPQRGGR